MTTWTRAVVIALAAMLLLTLRPAAATASEESGPTLTIWGESRAGAMSVLQGDTWDFTYTFTNDTGSTIAFGPDHLAWIYFAWDPTNDAPTSTANCEPVWSYEGDGAEVLEYSIDMPEQLADGDSVVCTLTHVVTASDVEFGGLWTGFGFDDDITDDDFDGWWIHWFTAPGIDDWPSVVGNPGVGSVLKTKLGFLGPWDRSPTYQWYRDDEPIPGATGANYRVTIADIGAILRVDVVGGTGLTMATSASTPAVGITDIGKSAFFTEISWFAAQGITTGYPNGDGTFAYRPYNAVTRDAMAAFLYRYAGSPAYEAPAVSPFVDVTSETSSFYTEICWLFEQGISTGWDNGDGTYTFAPFEPITRDAMAAFLYRFAGEPEWDAPAVSPFVDVSASKAFYDEITWLADSGITTGWTVGGKKEFRPFASITRDAMAAFLYRFSALTGP